MTLLEAFEEMQNGKIGIHKGREYFISMDVLLTMPYGFIAKLTHDMIVEEWQTREQ